MDFQGTGWLCANSETRLQQTLTRNASKRVRLFICDVCCVRVRAHPNALGFYAEIVNNTGERIVKAQFRFSACSLPYIRGKTLRCLHWDRAIKSHPNQKQFQMLNQTVFWRSDCCHFHPCCDRLSLMPLHPVGDWICNQWLCGLGKPFGLCGLSGCSQRKPPYDHTFLFTD